jgi:HD superfamily phosphohydrolase
MRRFTVRDFIGYNNPCFSCGEQISFNVVSRKEGQDFPATLTPTVTPDYTEIDLIITFTNTLKLYVFHKTNKILTSGSQRNLTDYLETHKLSLLSFCRHCNSRVETQSLTFDLAKSRVEAVCLASEWLNVVDKNSANRYTISSSFPNQQSHLTVYSLDRLKPLSPLSLDLPLLPRYRFKNMQRFLEKMKLITVFH